MDFYEEAKKKLKKELPSVHGQKEGAIKAAALDALLNLARQEEEFAQAIVQGGTFADCMRAVCKGVGNSISDLEVYSRAAAFYFPGCRVRFEMHIDLAGDAGGSIPQSLRDSLRPRSQASLLPALATNVPPERLLTRRALSQRELEGEAERGKKAMVIDLTDFL